MTDAQINHMVQRFLAWRLPANFNPDAGISFKPTFNDHLETPTRHEPIGTNLLDHTQATAMVRHIIDGMPPETPEGTAMVTKPLDALKIVVSVGTGGVTEMRNITINSVSFWRSEEGVLFFRGYDEEHHATVDLIAANIRFAG